MGIVTVARIPYGIVNIFVRNLSPTTTVCLTFARRCVDELYTRIENRNYVYTYLYRRGRTGRF